MPDLIDKKTEDNQTKLHANMVEWFGLPIPTERQYEEVFGWYHADGGTRYWSFDPQEERFRVVSDDDHRARKAELSGVWEDGDLETISRCMDHLQFLPRPALPADPTKPARDKPFAFEGWLLAWFYFPELRRWELGVIERRWRPAPENEQIGEASTDAPIGREERRERLLSIASKTITAGEQLFDRYRRSMMLIGSWAAPDPETGFRLIAGAASAAAAQFDEQTDIVRLVSRATGCSEKHVQWVIEYFVETHFMERSWFRGACMEVVIPDILALLE